MASANHLIVFEGIGMSDPGSASNITVDASNDGWGAVFQADSADAITHLGFRYGSRTGTPPTYSIRLEGVDSTGLPDNTDLGGGSATAKTFTPPASTAWDGTWQWVALTNSYTPTRGQYLAATIRYSSGTIDASNNSSFTRSYGGITASSNSVTPYTTDLAAGAWTKRRDPSFGYRTANGRYGHIAQGEYSTLTANTAGHRSASHFTLPSGWGSTFKVLGAQLIGDAGISGGSTIFGLWDTSWNLIQGITFDGDYAAAIAKDGYRFYFDEASLTALSFGTKYYIGFEVVSGAVGIGGITLAEAEDRQAFPNGLNRGLVTYNGVTTTEDNTIMPSVALILDDITPPSGGGGAIILPQFGYTGIGVS